jgi:hypothetical protein
MVVVVDQVASRERRNIASLIETGKNMGEARYV